MNDRYQIYKNFFESKDFGNAVTITDLKAKEFRNEKLSEEESQAILNFDRFRLSELNKIKDDDDFNARFSELQILSNLADYKEFLREEYISSKPLKRYRV